MGQLAAKLKTDVTRSEISQQCSHVQSLCFHSVEKRSRGQETYAATCARRIHFKKIDTFSVTFCIRCSVSR